MRKPTVAAWIAAESTRRETELSRCVTGLHAALETMASHYDTTTKILWDQCQISEGQAGLMNGISTHARTLATEYADRAKLAVAGPLGVSRG